MANSLKESYMRGSKGSHEGGEKELKRVTIKESDNGGFIVECSYETRHKKDSEKATGPMTDYEETTKVFEDFDGVLELLEDLYGD